MTMDPVTSQALEAAIEHWEENERAETPEHAEIFSEECALCHLFADEQSGSCTGCPVMWRTGEPSCKQSPWEGARDTWVRWERVPTTERRGAFRAAAREEIDFLKSLRDTPEETS